MRQNGHDENRSHSDSENEQEHGSLLDREQKANCGPSGKECFYGESAGRLAAPGLIWQSNDKNARHRVDTMAAWRGLRWVYESSAKMTKCKSRSTVGAVEFIVGCSSLRRNASHT